MKTSKSLISILSSFLSITLVISMMGAAFAFIICMFNIFGFMEDTKHEESFYIFRSIDNVLSSEPKQIETDYSISYNLSGVANSDLVHNTTLDTVSINDNTLRGRILGNLKMLFVMLLGVLMLKELSNIFISLDSSIKNKEWFSLENYLSIRKIAFYLLGVLLVYIVFSFIYFFLIDNVIINGIEVSIFPVIPFFSTIWSIAITLVIAHVYKEGVLLREEQNLTI